MRATAALVAYLLAACAATPRSRPSHDVATPLPALTLPRIDGGTWSSSSARGSVLVIDVWASWCKPCSKGFPVLDALAARRRDVVVVAITIDDDPAAIRAFVAQFPLAVPVVHDVDKQVTRPPVGITSLPALLIVDAEGVIRHRVDEPTEEDYTSLDAHIEALRTGSRPELR